MQEYGPMRRVSKEEFFARMDCDVHPRIVGKFPYRSEWRMQTVGQELIGVSQDTRHETEYFLPD